MNYEVNQTLTREDYMAYVTNQLYNYFFRPFNLIIFGVIIIYLLIVPIFTENYGFMLIAVGAIALNALLIFYTRSRAKKFYDKNQDLIKMELLIEENELVYKNTDGNLTKKWFEFESVKETEEYFFLNVNRQSGLIIVKRELSPEGSAFLVEKLKASIKPKKLKLLNKLFLYFFLIT
jgi:hypothetical protein